jgi:hypothetical protein
MLVDTNNNHKINNNYNKHNDNHNFRRQNILALNTALGSYSLGLVVADMWWLLLPRELFMLH